MQDGIDGVIVPQENDKMAEAIASFIQDKSKQDNIISYLFSHHFGNESEAKIIDNEI